MAQWEIHHKKDLAISLTFIALTISLGLLAYRYGDEFTRQNAIQVLKTTEPSCFPAETPDNCSTQINNAACPFICNLHQNLIASCHYCSQLLIAGVALMATSLGLTTALFYKFSQQEKREKSQRKLERNRSKSRNPITVQITEYTHQQTLGTNLEDYQELPEPPKI